MGERSSKVDERSSEVDERSLEVDERSSKVERRSSEVDEQLSNFPCSLAPPLSLLANTFGDKKGFSDGA